MELIARLGQALYILSWLIGGPLLALMLWGTASGAMATPDLLLTGIASLIVLVTGRGMYFVLSGY